MTPMHTNPPPSWHSRTHGVLLGGAFGDALGRLTEFISVEEITAKWGPLGLAEPPGDPALITDDTQMTLAVARAVDSLRPHERAPLPAPDPAAFAAALTSEFVTWLRSPDNDRAPGNTCLDACRDLERGRPWVLATVAGSKGCGANMRVSPVALAWDDLPTVGRTAQLQAALTHGHPTAVAAADITAATIWALTHDVTPHNLLGWLNAYIGQRRGVYEHDWLGRLWERNPIRYSQDFTAVRGTPEEWSTVGWDEVSAVLVRVEDGVRAANHDADPCVVGGDGWVAEEAWATALLCFLLAPTDPVWVLRRAATTRGDSDSIASIAGMFAGAALGMTAWPPQWSSRIEHSAELATFAARWANSPR